MLNVFPFTIAIGNTLEFSDFWILYTKCTTKKNKCTNTMAEIIDKNWDFDMKIKKYIYIYDARRRFSTQSVKKWFVGLLYGFQSLFWHDFFPPVKALIVIPKKIKFLLPVEYSGTPEISTNIGHRRFFGHFLKEIFRTP